MTRFEVGKKYYGPLSPKGSYKTCVGIHDGRPILHAPGTNDLHWLPTNVLDQWKEYKEPITVEGWVNVYDPPFNGNADSKSLYLTEASAKEDAKRVLGYYPGKRVTTVYVKGTSDG